MTDRYLMDGNKMMWHPDRVSKWLNGEVIAPLHIDAGLSKGCNIRCHYCFGVIQGNFYKKGYNKIFPRKPLLKYIKDAGDIGVKSMGLVGEGEPLLNPAVYDAIRIGKKSGMDMALATNGALFNRGKDGEDALERLTWIRFNISAASDDAYRKLHGSKSFDDVINNIRFCVQKKEENDLPVTIGLQSVLTPRDAEEMVPLAKLGKELGVDYHVIKQCSDTRDNRLGIYDKLGNYSSFSDILEEAEAQSEGKYNVIAKWSHIMGEGKREYDHCMGVPFLLYTSGDGKVFGCGMFFEKEWWDKFLIGDLMKDSLTDILHSDRYKEVIKRHANIDCHKFCYSDCRTHSINEYVWKLLHPPEHKNFI